MRKHYLDNLRLICILLLFPFHTAMIYNDWGEAFYIHGGSSVAAGTFMTIVYPWWMTLLFVIAGMSSVYALKKKSVKEYARERLHKLLIPFCVGMLIIIPVQSYIADMFHNGYEKGYIAHLKVFFTKFTDMTGYDGGFTPGHLWFVLFLFVISILLLPFMNKYIHAEHQLKYEKMNIFFLLSLFFVVLVCTPILEIGKSVGEALACFAIGFFILSSDVVQERLSKNVCLLGGLFVLLLIIRLWMWFNGYQSGLVFDIQYRMYLWTAILFFLAIGQRWLNASNKVSTYLSKASFPLYYFHQSILVMLGYWVLKNVENRGIQFILIMFGSFIFSLLCYEIIRRNRVTSYMFGVKQKK